MSDHAVSSATFRWRIDDFYWGVAAQAVAVMFILGWLALRSNRWWPLVAAAAVVLIVLVHGLTIVTSITPAAAVSARVGLWMVVNIALLAGVAERWLAGERAVGDRRTWRRRRPLQAGGPSAERGLAGEQAVSRFGRHRARDAVQTGET
ncbi:MAG: hypothetical protein QME55_08755 [Brevundimonas sp.]|uniref:hypothetical protein n=1 Tax=Brevundimonas sp. TaxID=1871086 RepID=UPI00260935C5|nr:hypothetical protein [Brevundimonas sp.]MDI6624807.1 hypothetical protein [Brevundimonas sp.]MDQ7812837.1 hypothetical protein [Brevundimonas sp.]